MQGRRSAEGDRCEYDEIKDCHLWKRGEAGGHMAPRLPENLVVGYASWNECDDRVLHAARQGVNVIVWFAINLVSASQTGRPAISGGPDLTCVRNMRAALEADGLPTVHMISIGGWNARHPPDRLATAEEWWDAFSAWNHQHPSYPPIFDGLDFDLEGSDAPAPSAAAHLVANTLSVPCLNLIGRLSMLAKSHGLLVSLAPPQSYLSASTAEFNRTALQPPLGWPHSPFRYAGRNAYAYLLARYGRSPQPEPQPWPLLRSGRVGSRPAADFERVAPPTSPHAATESAAAAVPTFDWVFLQLYESWSLAHAQVAAGLPFGGVLKQILSGFSRSWLVDFGKDSELNFASARTSLPPSAVVIGLANGWAAGARRGLAPAPPGVPSAMQPALFLCPSDVRVAYESLPASLRPRGFGFWSIADEGARAPCGKEQAEAEQWAPLFLAAALNEILGTRPCGQRQRQRGGVTAIATT